MNDSKDISVVIPLWNEEESLRPLLEWIQRVMDENKFRYEVIFVNDGTIPIRPNRWLPARNRRRHG